MRQRAKSMIANESGSRAVRDSSKLGKTLGFMRLLLAVDHALDGCSKRMQARHGITAPQRLLVRIVGRFPGITAGDVAAIMEVHPSTITGVLRRLEKRRWIQRSDDRSDRRRALLSLSADGKRFDELRTGTVEAAIRRAQSRVSAQDLEATERVLRTVVEELAADTDSARSSAD